MTDYDIDPDTEQRLLAEGFAPDVARAGAHIINGRTRDDLIQDYIAEHLLVTELGWPAYNADDPDRVDVAARVDHIRACIRGEQEIAAFTAELDHLDPDPH